MEQVLQGYVTFASGFALVVIGLIFIWQNPHDYMIGFAIISGGFGTLGMRRAIKNMKESCEETTNVEKEAPKTP